MFSISTTSMAQGIQSLESLTHAAYNYAFKQAQYQVTHDDIQVTTGQLDPRLRLVACSGQLIAFTPPGSRPIGNTTVGVRCDGPKPWSIYIPVKISLYEEAVVATQPLKRGQIIKQSDIKLTKVDISTVRGFVFNNVALIVGSKAKTTIHSGSVIGSSSVCVVCKGDSVSITAKSTSIAVAMSGIALSDGAVGENVRVQNNSSKRIVDAVVINQDTVKVGI